MRRAGIMAVFIPVISLLTFSAAAAVLWYGGRQVIDGAVSPGELFAFVLFAGILIGPFSSACPRLRPDPRGSRGDRACV